MVALNLQVTCFLLYSRHLQQVLDELVLLLQVKSSSQVNLTKRSEELIGQILHF